MTEAGPPPSEPGWTEASSLTSSWLAACHPSLPPQPRPRRQDASEQALAARASRKGWRDGWAPARPQVLAARPPPSFPPGGPAVVSRAALDAPEMRVVLAPAGRPLEGGILFFSRCLSPSAGGLAGSFLGCRPEIVAPIAKPRARLPSSVPVSREGALALSRGLETSESPFPWASASPLRAHRERHRQAWCQAHTR